MPLTAAHIPHGGEITDMSSEEAIFSWWQKRGLPHKWQQWHTVESRRRAGCLGGDVSESCHVCECLCGLLAQKRGGKASIGIGGEESAVAQMGPSRLWPWHLRLYWRSSKRSAVGCHGSHHVRGSGTRSCV